MKIQLFSFTGLAFRQQAINQYHKRLRDLEKNNENNDGIDLSEMNQKLSEFQNSHSSDRLLQLIKELPNDWRVVQLSVNDLYSDSRFKKTPADQAVLKNLALKMVVIQCGDGENISIHDIPALPDQDKMPSVQKELQDILKDHVLLYKTEKDKSDKYKKLKEEVDTRMESLVRVMEDKWLGYKKVLLLGKVEIMPGILHFRLSFRKANNLIATNTVAFRLSTYLLKNP